MNNDRFDILIRGGVVITMDDSMTMIQDGAVAVKGDSIASLGKAENFARADADRVVDAEGGIIMPGLVNTHTHAAMTCFRGLADDLPLMTWLHDHIFPAEAKLNPDMVYKGALLACVEMIMSGITFFSDMYLFEEHVAAAARDAGMRALVGEVLYDFPSPSYGDLEAGFEYTKRLADRWRDHPLINIAIEPHSPYLCSPELFRAAREISLERGIPMITHLSETKSEVDEIRKKYGVTPVAHLAGLGVLSPEFLACHAVELTDEDIDILAESGAKVSHNPQSNMKLASGIAPVPKLLEAGVCVGLGTDGCASNNDLDMFSEMDDAAKLHKVATLDPTALDCETVLKMATAEGAKALGFQDVTGSISEGKKADIIIIDTNKPHLTPMYNPYSHLVYSAKGSDVETVVINGRIVMENRRVLTVDVAGVMADVREICSGI